jgi:hypothetical protein
MQILTRVDLEISFKKFIIIVDQIFCYEQDTPAGTFSVPTNQETNYYKSNPHGQTGIIFELYAIKA